jgi:hypothetical protein
MFEEWREVPGYGGKYLVGSDGSVVSLKGKSPRVLAASPTSKGYLAVSLSGPGGRVTRSVHRLVASVFLAQSHFMGAEVRHLDGVKTNNSVGNLKWGTAKENAQDRIVHGTNASAAKTHCKWGHEFNEKNTHVWGGFRYCRVCDRNRKHAKRELGVSGIV